jgi:hypothetical protein
MSNLGRRDDKRDSRYAEAFSGPISGYDHAEYLSKLRCWRCFSPPPCDPHHVIPRSRGGKWYDQIPLCRNCHENVYKMKSLERQMLEWARNESLKMTGEAGEHLIPPPTYPPPPTLGRFRGAVFILILAIALNGCCGYSMTEDGAIKSGCNKEAIGDWQCDGSR